MEKIRLDRIGLRRVMENRVWRYVPPPAGEWRVHVSVDTARNRRDLRNRVVATEVELADGSRVWALLENLNVSLPEFTRHRLFCHFFVNSRWWKLARYFDDDAEKRGPLALSEKLNKPMSAVFPIRYDVTEHCCVFSDSLKGLILAEPAFRLTPEEIMMLAVPR